MKVRQLASVAVFTALVFICTIAFNFGIPATNGYFNIGEVMVYTTALVMGPYIGAIAGGLGSALSDAVLAPQYVPGTFVIKSAEGFIVGMLGTRVLARLSKTAWRITTTIMAIFSATLVWMIGKYYLTGSYTFSLGFSIGPQANFEFNVPEYFWYVVSAITFSAILLACLFVNERVGWTVISILVGGAEMVLGYFLYESFALNLGFASALAEVPYNIGQATVGLLVATPLSATVKKIVKKSGSSIGLEARKITN